MLITPPLSVFELFAARLCHDLIGPVAAIANGVELLGEDDPDSSARPSRWSATAREGQRAAAIFSLRLRFRRRRAGRSGAATSSPPSFRRNRDRCDYREAARALPLERQKLACTMLVVAGEALSRGGQAGARGAASGGPEIEAIGARLPCRRKRAPR